MYTLAFYFSLFPLSHITISFARSPNSLPILQSVLPLAVIWFAIIPYIISLSMPFIILKLAFVIAIDGNLISLYFIIVLPRSLKFWILTYKNPHFVFFPSFNHSKVEWYILIQLYAKFLFSYQIVNVYLGVDWLIYFNKIWYFLFDGYCKCLSYVLKPWCCYLLFQRCYFVFS